KLDWYIQETIPDIPERRKILCRRGSDNLAFPGLAGNEVILAEGGIAYGSRADIGRRRTRVHLEQPHRVDLFWHQPAEVNRAKSAGVDAVYSGSSCRGLKFTQRYPVTIGSEDRRARCWQALGAIVVKQNRVEGRERSDHARGIVGGVTHRAANIAIERN